MYFKKLRHLNAWGYSFLLSPLKHVLQFKSGLSYLFLRYLGVDIQKCHCTKSSHVLLELVICLRQPANNLCAHLLMAIYYLHRLTLLVLQKVGIVTYNVAWYIFNVTLTCTCDIVISIFSK